MKDTRPLSCPAAREQREHLGAAFAIVEQDGERKPLRAVEHPLEDLDLLLPRRVVVVEVEADLADRGDLRAPRERLECGAVAGGIEVLRLVGMDADRGEDALARFCQRGRAGRVGERRSGNEKPRDASLPGAREQDVGARGAVSHLQVTVGIGEQAT